MPRIRSIHPGLFSDPEFAGLSCDAQMFYLGLLTEADDNGIFEWKPSMLRIRLRPLKDGDVEPLLFELKEAQKIDSYEMGGRHYGAIRNFRRFQRPKSPKSWHPILSEFRIYVGLSDENGETPTPQVSTLPPKGEMSPQMEEEGGRRKDEGGNSVAKATGDADAATPKDLIFSHCLPWLIKRSGINERSCRGIIGAWMRDYGDDAVLAAMQQAEGEKPVDPVPWITGKFKPRESYEQRRQRENLALINAYEATDDRH